MKKVFLIQSAFVSKVSFEKPLWNCLYFVFDEKQAQRDCVLFQSKGDGEYLGYSFKFIYRYVSLDVL